MYEILFSVKRIWC